MTDVEFVRLRIGDVAKTIFPNDTDIQAFIDANSGDLWLAAADACMAIAADAGKYAKVQRIGEYEIDRTKVPGIMMKLAQEYRKMSAEQPADGYYEQSLTDWNVNEIIYNEALRQS